MRIEIGEFMKRPFTIAFLVAIAVNVAAPSTIYSQMRERSDDPFIGQWKLNGSKTKFTDRMKVEHAEGDKYVFDFGGGAETILVNGTEQPGNSDTTLTVTSEDLRTWKVLRKAHGRTLLTATWVLSKDGKTLMDDFTGFGANGSRLNTKYVYRRRAPGTGFAGDWISISGTLKSAYVIEIRSWDGDGLSFIDSFAGQTKNVKFDGKDYPREGANADPHATSSIRRVNDRALEMTDKVNGEISDTRLITVSSDLNRMTITVHVTGSTEPNILVLDRQ
jgi:hypothetical protein